MVSVTVRATRALRERDRAPVDDPVNVAVLDRRQDLTKEAPRFLFSDALVCYDVVEELAARGVLQHQADLGRGHDDLVQPGNVGVVQQPHHEDLAH